MKIKILATVIALTVITACASKPAPKLGENTVNVQAGDQALTYSEDRRLLDSGKFAGGESVLIKAQATVEQIDYVRRTVAIRTQEGKLTRLNVSKEVVNFDQIKPGDKVAVDYLLSVIFEDRKPTPAEIELDNQAVMAVARAKKGEKPKIAGIEEGIKIVTIESIDKKKELVVIKGTDGQLTTIKAKYPENLSYMKEGDKVVLKVTEAFAARVQQIN